MKVLIGESTWLPMDASDDKVLVSFAAFRISKSLEERMAKTGRKLKVYVDIG